MHIGHMIRTKFFDKRTRRKKAEGDLKTRYYYRQGVLNVTPVDNSNIGLYCGTYVFIRRYDKDRDQFLVEDRDGDKTWTDQVAPIRPSIDGIELYYTCFPLLVQRNYRPGREVCYRTQRGYAFLRKEIQTNCEEYIMFVNGLMNLDRVPRCFNFCLGYSENEAVSSFHVFENFIV